MDSKTLSFLNAFSKFSKEDLLKNPDCILPFFKSMLRINFDSFFDLWEFVLSKNSSLLTHEVFDKLLCQDILNLAITKNNSKTLKSLFINTEIINYLFSESRFACSGDALAMITYLIIANHFAEADTLLKALQKNNHTGKKFSENMVVVVETIFTDLLNKQGENNKKVNMSKKVSQFLLGYISKLRGAEKGLLEQRIREIM